MPFFILAYVKYCLGTERKVSVISILNCYFCNMRCFVILPVYVISTTLMFVQMELPIQTSYDIFHFWHVCRPCLGAELYMFDSNPVNEKGMSIEPGFLLSLTLCMKWKRVLERSTIRAVKLYCILAASLETCPEAAGTRSKQFDQRRTAEMVELNSKLLQYIKNGLRKARNEKKNSHCGMDMVTAFACFEPTDSGQGFSSCLQDVSLFPEGSYQIKWHACCVDENGSYFSLLPLNDGSMFSVRKS